MQEFYINKDSTLPLLKMEWINDGRYDFNEFYELIQSSTITFSMKNIETGVIKIVNNSAIILPKEGYNEEYFICYKWTKKDTKMKGKYLGNFKIIFTSADPSYDNMELIVPIQEELIINIQ